MSRNNEAPTSAACGDQERVVAAVRAGRDAEVEEHLAGCAGCRDAALATRFLAVAGRRTLELSTPPPAVLVWRRASAQRRQAVSRRAIRILRTAQAAAVVGALVLTPAAAAVSWGSFWRSAVGLLGDLGPSLTPPVEGGGAVVGLVVAATTLTVFTLYARWVEA